MLGPLHIPIVYGAPVGHTTRPMLTMPLGVRARLHGDGRRTSGHSGTGGARMTRPMHFHLSGIGGAAMAPLAGMLAESGHRVTGSDAGVYPPASTLLDSLGIRWTNGFDAANLDPAPDIVVLGNALSRGNPEVEAVLDRKIPYRSLPQTLEEFFLPGHDSLVVTGTHGKTTTTSMLSWILHHAGRHPNFLIGGVAENFGRSFGLGGGKEFVLEGDEYDSAFFDKAPKFLHYHPQEMIITSLEFDHADIYDRPCGNRASIPARGESRSAQRAHRSLGRKPNGSRRRKQSVLLGGDLWFRAWSRLACGRSGDCRRRDAIPRFTGRQRGGARTHGAVRTPQCAERGGGDCHCARPRRRRRCDRRSAWPHSAASCAAWK